MGKCECGGDFAEVIEGNVVVLLICQQCGTRRAVDDPLKFETFSNKIIAGLIKSAEGMLASFDAAWLGRDYMEWELDDHRDRPEDDRSLLESGEGDR